MMVLSVPMGPHILFKNSKVFMKVKKSEVLYTNESEEGLCSFPILHTKNVLFFFSSLTELTTGSSSYLVLRIAKLIKISETSFFCTIFVQNVQQKLTNTTRNPPKVKCFFFTNRGKMVLVWTQVVGILWTCFKNSKNLVIFSRCSE